MGEMEKQGTNPYTLGFGGVELNPCLQLSITAT